MPSPPSPSQRFQAGVRARKHLARSDHATLNHAACPHPSLDVLTKAEQGRLPDLLKLKHERMAASAFGFFRGAVPIMAADLAAHPNTGIVTQLCGDAHVLNLGAYASFDGRLVFDINDFDETIRGPFEWDLKRLATSLILAGRAAKIPRPQRNRAVRIFTEKYRAMMRQFAQMPVLDLARFQIHRITRIQPMKAIFEAAERATLQRSVEKLTEPADKRGEKRRFRDERPTLWPINGVEERTVLASLEAYAQSLLPERRHFFAQYHPVAVGFKVVGTGSVGLRDYCVYLESQHLARGGRGKAMKRFTGPGSDPLFLQIKEEPASAYAAYVEASPDQPTHQGHRVVNGQRAMQFTSDPFLGFTSIGESSYLVRQLNDHKAGLDITTLDARSLHGYADLCGEVFARGHARAGDPLTISAYLGESDKFDRAVDEFAHAYADKTEQDWASFRVAMQKDGTLDLRKSARVEDGIAVSSRPVAISAGEDMATSVSTGKKKAATKGKRQ
jgi:uncharacterized protein (DUF2252 family)